MSGALRCATGPESQRRKRGPTEAQRLVEARPEPPPRWDRAPGDLGAGVQLGKLDLTEPTPLLGAPVHFCGVVGRCRGGDPGPVVTLQEEATDSEKEINRLSILPFPPSAGSILRRQREEDPALAKR